MGKATVAVTDRGANIYVDPEDLRASRLVQAHGDFNPGSLRLWRQLVNSRSWPLVIDVGVNYGEMLVGVDLPVGATVIGFEPNPRILPYLRRTLAESGLTVDLRTQAVADRSGTASFAIDTTWSGTSSLVADETPDGERWVRHEVPVTTLDEVLGETPRSFCVKVDVEGFEPDVLRGAERAMSWSEPWAMLIEIAHVAPAWVAGLAERFGVLVLDPRTDQLLQLPGGNADLMRTMLRSTWLHTQDCAVVNEPALETLFSPRTVTRPQAAR